MGAKENILNAALELVREQGGDLRSLTMRAVCERAHVGLGLISYHYGGKDGLMAACSEAIVNDVIDGFEKYRDKMSDISPREKLRLLGWMTLCYLFDHEAVSRASILQDMQHPSEDSNTVRTFRAFVPLVAACRPSWDDDAVRAAAWSLIVQMQQAFMQCEHLRAAVGADLRDPEQRRAFHDAVQKKVLGEEERP